MGATTHPTRNAMLHRLKPLFRITVGKSSEVKTKMTQQLPTKDMRPRKAMALCAISSGLISVEAGTGIKPATTEHTPPTRK